MAVLMISDAFVDERQRLNVNPSRVLVFLLVFVQGLFPNEHTIQVFILFIICNLASVILSSCQLT